MARKVPRNKRRNSNVSGTVHGWLRTEPGEGFATMIVRKKVQPFGHEDVECVGLREDVEPVMRALRNKLVDVIFTGKDRFEVRSLAGGGECFTVRRLVGELVATGEPEWQPPERTASEELD